MAYMARGPSDTALRPWQSLSGLMRNLNAFLGPSQGRNTRPASAGRTRMPGAGGAAKHQLTPNGSTMHIALCIARRGPMPTSSASKANVLVV